MDRLTTRREDGSVETIGREYSDFHMKVVDCSRGNDKYDVRLAEYEDTSLTPEQILKLKGLEADNAGLLEVMERITHSNWIPDRKIANEALLDQHIGQLRNLLETHEPHGHNYTNQQYVNLRARCEELETENEKLSLIKLANVVVKELQSKAEIAELALDLAIKSIPCNQCHFKNSSC